MKEMTSIGRGTTVPRAAATIQADGSEHPSEYGNGHALIARWIGSHILEAVDVKDGQILGRGTYEVSGDGKTLTVSTNEQRIVLDFRAGICSRRD